MSDGMQKLFLAGAVVMALVFVKLMYDMTRSMERMTGHVATMAQDVRSMQENMRSMNGAMQRMERSINGLGRVFNQGSEQLQQMNPAGIMQQMWPGGGQRSR